MKISIIGAGNMGSAIACGLAGKEVFKGNITVSDASLPKLEELQKGLPGISICRGNVEACKCADVIILAVKPFMIKNVIEEIRDSLDCPYNSEYCSKGRGRNEFYNILECR